MTKRAADMISAGGLVKQAKLLHGAASAGGGGWSSVTNDILVFTQENVEHRDRIAGFDLDGTIITTKSGKVFAKDEGDWRFLYAEVPGRIRKAHDEGFKIIIFTNQKGLLTGTATGGIKAFKRKIEAICAKIPVPMQVFVSLGSLTYRKPYVGMWEFMEEHENGDVAVKRAESIFVGDAAGRPPSAQKPKKDHSSADRLFAMNLAVKFLTPEEFFLGKQAGRFELPVFNPAKVIDEASQLYDPKDTRIPLEEPEVLILVGYPGSGKSTLAETLHKKHGYEIVNRDTLKTWQKCVTVAGEQLTAGRSVCVDNTNPDRESRMRYIELAKKAKVNCRCFWLSCDYGQALHHAKYRTIIGTDAAHKDVNEMVFRTYRSKLQEPKLDEGFTAIVRVNFVPEFADPKHEQIYRMYLAER